MNSFLYILITSIELLPYSTVCMVFIGDIIISRLKDESDYNRWKSVSESNQAENMMSTSPMTEVEVTWENMLGGKGRDCGRQGHIVSIKDSVFSSITFDEAIKKRFK